MLGDDAVRWLVASLKWLVRCKYIAVFHLCAFHKYALLLGTRWKKKQSERTNKCHFIACVLLPGYRRLKPYRIIAIKWDRQKVCQHLLQLHHGTKAFYALVGEHRAQREKKKHQSRSLASRSSSRNRQCRLTTVYWRFRVPLLRRCCWVMCAYSKCCLLPGHLWRNSICRFLFGNQFLCKTYIPSTKLNLRSVIRSHSENAYMPFCLVPTNGEWLSLAT